jgi:hypothetical protein
MFSKFSPGSNQDMSMKSSSSDIRKNDQEMFEKISRIQESYVDAAIRSVKRKFSGKRKMGFEG